jgi:hypothetical protein
MLIEQPRATTRQWEKYYREHPEKLKAKLAKAAKGKAKK